MRTAIKPFLRLTAGDLMITDVIELAEDMPLRAAAQLMVKQQIGGAPVLDKRGRCVGILSATDFLRLSITRAHLTGFLAAPLPVTCSFQVKRRNVDGAEVTGCSLPPGVCPIQAKGSGPDGETTVTCTQPHCVLADWQVVNLEKLPRDPVRQFMTADPVTVSPSTSIRVLARSMIDAHIHRVIVVDGDGKPVGIVSATDVLAALAYAEDD